MNAPSNSVEDLKDKYFLGSIYLTYIPLNDMASLLNEKAKCAELAAETSAFPVIMDTFRTFLHAHRELRIHDAIAFVRLDLPTGKAGYKKISDRDGTIHQIAWSQPEVWAIARFSDFFLNRFLHFEKVLETMASGRLAIDDAWQSMTKLKADPYIPTARTIVLAHNFRSLVKKKRDVLAGLKSREPGLYDEIREFSLQYDRSMKTLRRKKALTAYVTKRVELNASMRDFYARYKIDRSMMREKKVRDSLRNSYAPLLEKVGYSIGTKGPVDESFIEICENFTAGITMPDIVTAQPFRQLISGFKIDLGVGHK